MGGARVAAGSAAERACEVLIVSLGSTAGLRTADEELRAALERAGASASLVRARAPAPTRTLVLTDLAWARAARTAATRALAAARDGPVPSIIYSSTTAAMFAPARGAIRFDALAAANRPGRHGIWQRPLERRRLREAPLLLPWSEGSLAGLPRDLARSRALVVRVPVERSDCPDGALTGADSEPVNRDVAVLTYAANPRKKGLDRLLAAWRAAREQSPALAREQLVIAGVCEQELTRGGWLDGAAEGVRVAGVLEGRDYRALLRRARVFACAPRREDYGIAQLEALADGCMLATTPAPGPYAALPIARELDGRLVGEDLAGALRAALEQPARGYAARARQALAAFERAAVDRVVAEDLLPRIRARAGLA